MPSDRLEPDDVVELARRVSGRVTYPIRDYKQLSEAVGGDETEVEFKGRKYKPGQVRRMFPGDYFPIDSEEDLVAKVGDLITRQEGEPPDMKWGKEEKEPPKDKQPPQIRDEDLPKPRGVPAVKGFKGDR